MDGFKETAQADIPLCWGWEYDTVISEKLNNLNSYVISLNKLLNQLFDTNIGYINLHILGLRPITITHSFTTGG